MFNNLLESKAKKQKRLGGSFASVVAHAAVVVGLVVVTANAGIKNEKVKEEKVDFVEVKKDEPKPPEPEKPPPPPDAVVTPPPPKGFQVLSAPVEIPNVIPDIDLSKKVTDEADFSGKGVAGGVAKGVEGGKGPVPQGDQPYFDGTASEYQRPAQDHECEKGKRRKPVLHDKKIVRAMEQDDQ